jgi:hypothetical protein
MLRLRGGEGGAWQEFIKYVKIGGGAILVQY